MAWLHERPNLRLSLCMGKLLCTHVHLCVHVRTRLFNTIVFTTGSHCFVMWTVERTVTVVRRQQVQTEVIVIGKELDVVWFAEIKYRARVAAIGTP